MREGKYLAATVARRVRLPAGHGGHTQVLNALFMRELRRKLIEIKISLSRGAGADPLIHPAAWVSCQGELVPHEEASWSDRYWREMNSQQDMMTSESASQF